MSVHEPILGAQPMAPAQSRAASCSRPGTGDCAGPNSATLLATHPHTATDITDITDISLQSPDAPQARLYKDPAPLIDHGDGNYETRLELLTERITSIPHFFVRNNGGSLALDAQTWCLQVCGDGVRRPLELRYRDILALPSRTVDAYLECAGNQRAMFDRLQGRFVDDGTQWMTGGVSNATWTGVPLATVLEMAGVRPDAVDLLLVGLDNDAPEGGFRRVLPIDKALHPDTLLVYAMNGEILLPDHGFPLRAIVPGWVGSNSIKWLGRIEVATQPLYARNNTTHYVLTGADYPTQPTPDGQTVMGQVVTTLTLKSVLALPWPATLPAGRHQLRGFAYAPDAPITQVEWSDNRGQSWQPATLLDAPHQYSWVRFAVDWTATPGEHTLMTRATDAAGNTQPEIMPFNERGYLFNQWLPHPIQVL